MRIARARIQPVRWPVVSDGAARGRSERASILLEVVTDEGHVGFGEAAPLPGVSVDSLTDVEAALAAFVTRPPFDLAAVLGELAISASGAIVMHGQRPPAPTATELARAAAEAGRQRARRESSRHAGAGMTQAVLDDVIAIASTTPSPAARFAIETALLAAAAREMGMPIATMLVPRPAASLPCSTVVDSPAAARRAVLAGVRTLKIKVGATGDVARVVAIHRAAPDTTLRIDANRSWPRERVLAILHALAELPIEYVEEPCWDSIALLSEPLPIPVALDESLATLVGSDLLASALESPHLAAIVVKPTIVGGFASTMRLAAQAREAGKRAVITHALEGPIGTAACAAIAVAIGERDTAVGLAPHPALAAWPIGLPHLTPAALHAALEPGLGLDRLTRLAARLDEPTRLVDLAGHLDRARDRAVVPNDIAIVTPTRSVRFDERSDSGPQRIAALAESRVVVAHPTLATVQTIHAALASRSPIALLHPRLAPDEAARQRALVEQATLGADTAIVLFTSGSTGHARGVVLSYAALDAAAAASEAHLGWRDDDRWLLALPLAHAGGLAVVVRCLAARKPVVLLEGDFERATCATLLEDATLASLVPTQLAALLDDPTWRPPARLRAVLLGGAAAPPALLEAAAARAVPFLVTYGMTETFGQIATAPLGHVGDPAASLIPLTNVEISGGTRTRPAPIHVRAPGLATAYLDGAPIRPELVTADLGFVEDGAIHVVGRVDDVIVTGGEKVHPTEVEAVLTATPGVRDACVFGVADPRWGQIVVAAIVVDAAFTEPAAMARWAAVLAAHARPRELAILALLPRTPNGKVDRTQCIREPRHRIDYV